MKSDNELQKPSHILVFDLEEGKVMCLEMYGAQKAKGLLTKMKYKKISGIDLKMRCFVQK